MIFGRFPVTGALGLVLAHTLQLPGRTLRKGRALRADDIRELIAADIREVAGARPEEGDLSEDAAASSLAGLLAGDQVDAAEARLGRCDLVARHAGLVLVDAERLEYLNLLNEGITVATLPPYHMVAAGQSVATVKIIPFAVPGRALCACRELLAGGPILRVAPFRRLQAVLILTELPGTRPGPLRAAADATRARLRALRSELAQELCCPHTEQAVADALTEALAGRPDVVLIFGASVTVDRRDVVPAGIELAGGRIDHFGLPVEPGNMLLLAHHGSVPVIDLPGCARSIRLNGLDWVLQRIAAGLRVDRRDIARMALGGLLKKIPQCPSLGREGEQEARRPRIAALIMAAGQSRRMAPENKLLLPVAGVPMVTRVADSALASKASSVVLVTGHQADRVEAALCGRAVRTVHNPDFAAGMSSSLACGLASLPEDVDGVIILLGDMPQVGAQHIDRVIDAFDPENHAAIVVPVRSGRRGNPVVWARRFFPEMQRIAGDVGARHLIGEHAALVREVPMEDDAVFVDVDTPEALAAAGGLV